jgi:bifunctional DNA-binding transcriptional regulator/antitoxin component of YhaV-PrlF toxin-antitoxin module
MSHPERPLQLTITAKGQVTLRQSVLEHLGIKPGHKVGVALLPDGRVELRAADTAPSVTKVRGALHRNRERPVSIEEMQEAIRHGSNR